MILELGVDGGAVGQTAEEAESSFDRSFTTSKESMRIGAASRFPVAGEGSPERTAGRDVRSPDTGISGARGNGITSQSPLLNEKSLALFVDVGAFACSRFLRTSL